MKLDATPSLRSALLDLYFREVCDQDGWAWAGLDSIHGNAVGLGANGVLAFAKGPLTIRVKIMQAIIPEVIEFTRPTGPSAFVFDYLCCRVGNGKHKSDPVASPSALCWVILNRGRDLFTANQLDLLSKTKLSVAHFYIRDVMASPRDVEARWDIRTGSEWLDKLDDMKEQAESDDDYY